jgi:hypothetical protein
MPGLSNETRGRLCDDLGSNIVVPYSVGPIITLRARITAKEFVDRLGNQVKPMMQTLFHNNDAVFQDNAPIHSAGTAHSWLKSMKVNFNIFPGQTNQI